VDYAYSVWIILFDCVRAAHCDVVSVTTVENGVANVLGKSGNLNTSRIQRRSGEKLRRKQKFGRKL